MGISTFVVTDAGATLLAQASQAARAVTFTRAAAGCGYTEALHTRTALINSVCDMGISSASIGGGVISVNTQFTNAVTDGFLAAFQLAEIGLFGKLGADGAETLIAYANARDAAHADYIPGDSLREFAFTFVLAFTGADAVDVSVDSSIVYVARAEFTALLEPLQAEVDAKVNTSDFNNLLEPLQAEVNAKLPLTGGTLTGTLVAGGDFALATGQVRNITIANAAPTGGVNGDVWIRYA